jgi:radical SAM superfamily enzyme YgiQ (UPF0313 family)
MKILLLAMSGVRAWSDELNRAGLTMPGVIERQQVIASLPSLGLLTLAGLTSPDIHIDYREIRDLRTEGADHLPTDYDLVAISTFSAQVFDAYAVADKFRALGIPVAMGGLHVTALPIEAMRHADAVIVGEAEPLWPRLLDDLRNNRLQRLYRAAPGEEFDLSCAPMPRFDLLEPERYNRLTVQTCRGCPHVCDFCASSIMLTKRYKLKPVEMIIDEIRAIKRIWRRPFIEFADDNSFVNRAHARKLLHALKAEKIRWFTECDVSIADDPGVLDLMRESGCRQVLIGLESPTASGLDGVELRRNWKLRQFDRYESAVRTIQSRGIAVNGCFVLGLDGHDESVFDNVFRFAERCGLFDVQITVPTPFPGTPMLERLRAEGRILHDEEWGRCTLFDVNFQPKHMTPERLEQGLVDLAHRLYEPAAVAARRNEFFNQARSLVRPDAMGQPEAA